MNMILIYQASVDLICSIYSLVFIFMVVSDRIIYISEGIRGQPIERNSGKATPGKGLYYQSHMKYFQII